MTIDHLSTIYYPDFGFRSGNVKWDSLEDTESKSFKFDSWAAILGFMSKVAHTGFATSDFARDLAKYNNFNWTIIWNAKVMTFPRRTSL